VTRSGRDVLRGTLDFAGRLVERLAVRTFAALGPLWRALYMATARAVAMYLRRGDPGATVLLRGSLVSDDAIYGMSDIDLAVVIERGSSPDPLQARWRRVAHAAPPLERLVDVSFHGDDELAAAAASTYLTYGLRGSPHGPPRRIADSIGGRLDDTAHVLMRAEDPGAWLVIAGPDRRPPRATRGPGDRRVAAWLEMQCWWRQAFAISADTARPDAARMCVKLLAEPARTYLALTGRPVPNDRRSALERACDAFPEEEEALRRGLRLAEKLHTRPEPPLREAIGYLARVTTRVARALDADAHAASAAEVALVGHGSDPLALAPDAARGLQALGVPREGLLPLVDWWARAAVPRLPDEVFAIVDGDPSDPAELARLLAACGDGDYAALRGPGFLVMLVPGARGVLRSVQCPATDPVSFALADGSRRALFPQLPGLSAEDSARRAVAEHAGWLRRQPRGGVRTLPALGMLLTAARAAIFLETVLEGRGELPVTMSATARMLGDRDGGEFLAEEAFETYEACRREGKEPHKRIVIVLDRIVRDLPAYRRAGVGVEVA
jgi:hypothetical protein